MLRPSPGWTEKSNSSMVLNWGKRALRMQRWRRVWARWGISSRVRASRNSWQDRCSRLACSMRSPKRRSVANRRRLSRAARPAPTSRVNAASFGTMPTTLVRCLISQYGRSRELVECSWERCSLGV